MTLDPPWLVKQRRADLLAALDAHHRLLRYTRTGNWTVIDELAVRHAMAGHRMHLTIAERRAAVVALTDLGWAAARIAVHLQISHRTVTRLRSKARLAATERGVHRGSDVFVPQLWENDTTPKTQQGQTIPRSQLSSEVA